ncbi:hypothetical protein QAD02_014485 [Eretmocerus hayati]|uniref:Uncharacterized protein n=1 Tax=Eretmocerus hayati TaxID=131215 RepID=A0ACC2P5E9_9HYME|nr:hypothetical protein QAD02_014485 [Eretmocerus hayati]
MLEKNVNDDERTEEQTQNSPSEPRAETSTSPLDNTQEIITEQPKATVTTESNQMLVEEFAGSTEQITQSTSQDTFSKPFIRPKRPQRNSTSSNGSTKTSALKAAKNVKKHKPDYSKEIVKEQLRPAISFLEEKYANLPGILEKLENFVFESHGSSNVVELARKLSDDLSTSKNLLLDTRDHATNRTLKARLTKIIKKLEKAIEGDEASDEDGGISSADESLSSASSQTNINNQHG